MRMVHINTEETKGLLEVKGETLIERLIKQLREVGIKNIEIVVGFMKEHYEFLIDNYQVNLVVNSYYKDWKNIYSLFLLIILFPIPNFLPFDYRLNHND